ncbi:laccase 3 [Mycena belliarum]|uniref:Laccase 3 n=1 Tax=Mycena belliarum TaxID=1033014 RepID=A0AAD6UHU5_9AGAR|nr:laccase 3 [Mycena belliae]
MPIGPVKSLGAIGPIGRPVSECPIAANNSFLYDFVPSGTFWYHSHLSLQSCDGLRGPLIIYDPQDPHRYLYVESTIISLADWYNPAIPFLFTSNLINGKGRFAGGPASPLAVITVVPGLRYRFRLISMSCEPNFVFSIDGHEMTIIEADGISTKPVVADSIQIHAGQRVSFILEARKRVDNYWIRSVPNIGDKSFTGGVNSAILRYLYAPNRDPRTQSTTSTKPLLESSLHPLKPVPVPGKPVVGGADVVLNLNIGLNLEKLQYTLNGEAFLPPAAPALLQILSGAKTAQDLLPKGGYIALPPNKVIEISIPGGTDPASPHPFHLHGHNFHVIRNAGSDQYNFKDPVIRDVVNTGFPGDNVTFRFVTDNAGPWFLHCHIDFHLDIGLGVVFAEDIATTAKEFVPAAWKDLCPTYDGLTASQLR